MIEGKEYNGLMADIWSCGVILYAMVCGYLPFEDDDTNVLYQKILSGVFELPEFLSREVKSLLQKVLRTDPGARYNIEKIRRHPWFSLVSCESSAEQELTVGCLFIFSSIQMY
eukprot:TRINITY_DN25879_c0_g1_i1.p3 TRINITY_DN25879_c0_g1~~TRINITY_DN25879_c0_g1_i1.p3  ORF type:complete len:113 (+),score=13.04 TRINITY_DN25879_c0_g1_i1:724-1062(+)